MKRTTVEGVKPSAEGLFYKKWGEETLKDNIATLNGTFRLFITLETGLLSAYLGFYDKLALSPFWLKMAPAALVTISLIASIIGIYPFATVVNLSVPEDIKAYKQRRARFKSRCLVVASVALISGFVSLLIARLVP